MPLEKLTLLEQRVTQMIGLVNDLQKEKLALQTQVSNLTNQVQSISQDLEHERRELELLSKLKEENQRFQEERGQVYAKLETMLNGLEGIQI